MKLKVRKALTKRQITVLRLMNKGYKTKDIALTLGISEQTVAVHRKHIMRRTGCHNIFDIVQYCRKNNVK